MTQNSASDDGAHLSLADQYEAECRTAIDECQRLRPPYNPTAWKTMIDRHGAVAAAQRLVTSGDIQSGFSRLVRAGRLDLTIEWSMLLERWRPLFGPSYRDAARWRLHEAGIQPPGEQ